MTTITFPAVSPTDISTQTVYQRAAWSDAWTANADLHCMRLSFGTGESVSSAVFHYRFGDTLPWGASAWQTKAVTTVAPRNYVRVTVTGTGGRANFDWYGLWKSATKGDDRQRFHAVGLEWLLEEPCRDAPFVDASGTLRWAGRGFAFNANNEPNRAANMEKINGVWAYPFTDVTDNNAEYWTSQEAARTVLAMATPKDDAGAAIFNWQPVNFTDLPDYDQPLLPTHGRSFRALLQSLIPRYRLSGWRVYGDSSGSDVFVGVYSFAENDIKVENAAGTLLGTIFENADQIDLSYAADQSASATLTTEASHVVDQVVATGDRPEIVFTLSKADSTIDRDWTDADVTTYKAGASGAGDYPAATEVREREQRDRDARNDETLRHVYSRFVVAEDWNQRAGDGENGAATLALLFEDDEVTPRKLPRCDLAFSANLPLCREYSYDGSKIADNQDQDHKGQQDAIVWGGPKQKLPLLCFCKTVDASILSGLTERWQRIDQVGHGADLEEIDGDSNRKWSASVQPLDGHPGIELRVNGAERHVLGYSDFNTPTKHADHIPGAIKWEALVFTVCVRDTQPVQAKYPDDENLSPLGEYVQRLHVEAPGNRLVEVRPNTVVSVSPETLALQRSDGGYVVDHRDQLEVIARRAYEWHRVPRYALQLTTGWIDGALAVGQLVTQATDASGTYPVLSVITELTIEFPARAGNNKPKPSLSIQTAFGEMDAAQLL